MQEYSKLLLKFYTKELQEDKELFEGLVHVWILVPRDTSIHTYMAMYGLFGCMVRVLVILLVRVPVWWPLNMGAYVVNFTVRYTMVPLFAFIHLQLDKAMISNNTLGVRLYSGLLTCISWIEWVLKTVFLFTYLVQKIVNWAHNRRTIRGYINYKIDQIVVYSYNLRNQKHKQGWVSKSFITIRKWWGIYIVPIPSLLWKGILIIIKYANPLNYKWVKHLVYRKNREKMILIFKCRIIIRYAIFKGLIKYGYTGWIKVRVRRWVRRFIHVFRVIQIKYHPVLALLKLRYWVAFHIWWITTLIYRGAVYSWIYFTGGLLWLLVCVAMAFTPICYILLHILYANSAVKIWFTHGIWISRGNFYLMVGWNPKELPWKAYTRVR